MVHYYMVYYTLYYTTMVHYIIHYYLTKTATKYLQMKIEETIYIYISTFRFYYKNVE